MSFFVKGKTVNTCLMGLKSTVSTTMLQVSASEAWKRTVSKRTGWSVHPDTSLASNRHTPCPRVKSWLSCESFREVEFCEWACLCALSKCRRSHCDMWVLKVNLYKCNEDVGKKHYEYAFPIETVKLKEIHHNMKQLGQTAPRALPHPYSQLPEKLWTW